MTWRFGAVGSADVDDLQDLLESAPDYSERVTGVPPGPSDALSTLIGLPENLAAEDKFGFGLWDSEQLVAFADVLRGYPDRSSAFIGLLLVRGDRHREGVGRRLHERVLGEIGSWGAVDRVELGVVATNASVAEPFWAALGYLPTGRVRPWRYGGMVTSTARWQLLL